MYQLTPQDFNKPREEKMTRQERDLQKETQKKAEGYGETMKALMLEFFNDKIVPSDIPICLVEEYMFTYFRAAIAVYKTKSKEWDEHIKAKEKFDLSPIKDLTIDEKSTQ